MADVHTRVLPTLTIAGRSLRVLRFSLDERISELPVLTCELHDEEAALPRPGEVIDQRAVLKLERADGSVIVSERLFAGVVISAELGPDQDDVPALSVEVAPILWQLGQRADCRIFQEKSAVDIVKEVLTGAGVPASAQSWQITESHPSRIHTAQYRETDLDFVLRLLSEEGIWFAIHTKGEEEVITFSDAPDGAGDIEGETTLSYFDDFGFEGAADRVTRLGRTVSVQSDKAYVRDYDPEKPKVKVEGEAEGKDEGAHVLEIYEYPARTVEAAEAKRRAQILVDAAQAKRDVVHGETGSIALLPGLRFSVDGHPYDPLNQEYLVLRSRIEGSNPRPGQAGAGREPAFRVEFWGIPTKTSRCRPERRRRERVIPGAQTAMTTGPSGEEIHTDAAGRVKVQYHWDRLGKKDDKSSRWIRTLQSHLGGSMLLPRMDWEVTVRHEDGDADRPLVLGRMYNGEKPPPYALPKHAGSSALQTATTPGGGSSNEFKMSDTKGSEAMSFNASKDMSTHVKNNATESVGVDQKKKVGGNQSRNVTNSQTTSVGSNQDVTVGGNQSVKVETFHVDQVGSHSLSIGGNRDMKVGGDHKRDVGGASTASVGGNRIDLVVGSVTDKTLGSFDHTVGAALIELAVGDRSVTVGADRSETAGAAKVIAVAGGRGVEVGGSLNVKVAGAIINVASGDRAEEAKGTYTELAAGAQLVKANNVAFEAEGMLTLVMGASILSLTPASAAVLGLSVKMDGDVSDLAALVVDN